jgi:hypothetical protein
MVNLSRLCIIDINFRHSDGYLMVLNQKITDNLSCEDNYISDRVLG